VNKPAASAIQLAKCILFYTFSRTTACAQPRENKRLIADLTVGITVFLMKMKNKLRTVEAENP